MNSKQISIGNKKIEIYDDVFTASEKIYMYEFANNSRYIVERVPNTLPERLKYRKTLKCGFTLKDSLNFKFFHNKFVLDYIKSNKLKFERCYINLCGAGDTYQYHVDTPTEGVVTGLYYLNLEWDPVWEGETHFSDENMKEILYTSSFLPGRLVFFDGTIPHKSSQPAAIAPYYRFVFAVKFTNDNDLEEVVNKSVNIEDFIYSKDHTPTELEQRALSIITENTKFTAHTNSSLYNHLFNTFCILKEFGVSEEVCIAGMLHSIYETDYFKHNLPFDRNEIVKIFGSYTNSLIEYFCSENRDKLILENTKNLNDNTILDLLYILYANLIEQAYRIDIEEQKFALIRDKILILKNKQK